MIHIKKSLLNADTEINSQRSIIDAKTKELDVIREKYDEDKRRFLELSGGGKPAAMPVAPK